MTVIQWYPGHMAKALRQVKENLNAVDIVLELVDARLPESSRNPQLEELLQNKKSIIVLTKMDLADPKLTREWITYYEQNGHPAIAVNSNQGTLPAIEKKIKEVLKEKIAAKETRGIKNSRIKAMCIGIPNVGKINPSQSIGKEKRRNRRQQARGHQGAAMAESRFKPVAA